MPAAPDAHSLTTAAEQAASTGDYVSAEQYLKAAVELQEASGGPTHPDLANTLNNLGVVCERLEKPADAENCYRRAYAIASAALDADHPFVVLSAKNLRDFCEARNIPFEPPAAAPSPVRTHPTEPPQAGLKSPPPQAALEPRDHTSISPPPPAVKRVSARRALAGIGLLALAGVALVVTRSRSTGDATTAAPPVPSPAAATAAPVKPASTDGPAPTSPPSPRPSIPEPKLGPTDSSRVVRSATAVEPTLIDAGLCLTLDTNAGEWRCVPASGVLQPGALFFYTRVASPTDTTIEHRWYRNERLHQVVPLHVRANQRSGYRTYSRMTVSAERTGDWRVELRTVKGTVLRAQHFTVGAPRVPRSTSR
jgi:Tetratricopeptide repeat/Protein of unknown function (DUF2914)